MIFGREDLPGTDYRRSHVPFGSSRSVYSSSSHLPTLPFSAPDWANLLNCLGSLVDRGENSQFVAQDQGAEAGDNFLFGN
jgi:hypothetical protein